MAADCFMCALLQYCLLFVCACVGFVYLYFKHAFGYWKRKGVECLEPAMPFGNFGKVFDGKSHITYVFRDIYYQIKGPFGGFYVFGSPSLMIKDPQLIKQILVKDFNNFPDRGIYTDPDDPLSGHLFRLTGNKWRNLRIKLSPTFTSGKLKMMFPLLIHQGQNYQNYLQKLVEKEEPVDAREASIRYTLDVIDSVAFGVDTNSFENPDNEMRAFSRTFFDRNNSYLQGVLNYLAASEPRILNMFRLKLFNQELTDFMYSILRRIIDYRETNKETRNDFLQMLIQLKNKGKVTEEDDAGDKNVYDGKSVQGLTFEELAAQAFIFLVAGYETSASTMTFTLYELAKNPEIQKKIQKQIKEVLDSHDGKFSYESVDKMEYLAMAIAETLRKYSPLGFLVRIAHDDYTIPGSDVIVEKGTHLVFSLLGLHSDPQYFPDPDKYDPERFSSENKESIVPYTYMPFGEGPRHCIGMQMGKMQSRLGLAMILSKYSFSVCAETPTTLTPKYGQVLVVSEELVKLKVEENKM